MIEMDLIQAIRLFDVARYLAGKGATERSGEWTLECLGAGEISSWSTSGAACGIAGTARPLQRTPRRGRFEDVVGS